MGSMWSWRQRSRETCSWQASLPRRLRRISLTESSRKRLESGSAVRACATLCPRIALIPHADSPLLLRSSAVESSYWIASKWLRRARHLEICIAQPQDVRDLAAAYVERTVAENRRKVRLYQKQLKESRQRQKRATGRLAEDAEADARHKKDPIGDKGQDAAPGSWHVPREGDQPPNFWSCEPAPAVRVGLDYANTSLTLEQEARRLQCL